MFVTTGWADPDALVDLPLGLLRTVCDRLVEMGQSDATGLELGPQDLAAIEEAGASMGGRHVGFERIGAGPVDNQAAPHHNVEISSHSAISLTVR